MKTIDFKLNDITYGFLSNFYPHEITDTTGVVWKSTEHFYQAMKTLNMQERAIIWATSTAREAKKLGKTVTLRSDWNISKVDVMRTALTLKFLPGTEISQKLCDTGSAELQEWAPWDSYWGLGKNGKGQNKLGKLLMEQRFNLNVCEFLII